MNFNDALDEYGQDVDAWLAVAKKQAAAVGKLQKVVAVGKASEIEDLRGKAKDLSEECAIKARECQPFGFDIEEYLQRDDGYLAEFKESAEKAELKIFERDGVIFCYPVLVHLNAGSKVAKIDKKKESTLRPDALVAILKKAQSREPKAKPERFIETLFGAYEYVTAHSGREKNADVALMKLYEVLTLLPGSKREYAQLDFARDLYFLDISGISETKKDKKDYCMSLPASTVGSEGKKGKKSGSFTFVTRDGYEKQYASIKFTSTT